MLQYKQGSWRETKFESAEIQFQATKLKTERLLEMPLSQVQVLLRHVLGLATHERLRGRREAIMRWLRSGHILCTIWLNSVKLGTEKQIGATVSS